jgi:hypothetical protein
MRKRAQLAAMYASPLMLLPMLAMVPRLARARIAMRLSIAGQIRLTMCRIRSLRLLFNLAQLAPGFQWRLFHDFLPWHDASLSPPCHALLLRISPH